MWEPFLNWLVEITCRILDSASSGRGAGLGWSAHGNLCAPEGEGTCDAREVDNRRDRPYRGADRRGGGGCRRSRADPRRIRRQGRPDLQSQHRHQQAAAEKLKGALQREEIQAGRAEGGKSGE